jgi:hypothetical protein
MIHRSSLWPVEVAVAAAINADSALEDLLAGDRVYSRIAPAKIADPDDAALEIDTPYPFVVLGERTESQENRFDDPGERGSLTIHIWSREIGNRQLSLIYDELARVLGVPLTLSDGVMFAGWLEYVTDSYDQEGEAMHGIAEYRRLTSRGG